MSNDDTDIGPIDTTDEMRQMATQRLIDLTYGEYPNDEG